MTAPEPSTAAVTGTPAAVEKTSVSAYSRRLASKAKGTSFETAVVRYLQECGWSYAERRATRGSKDAGDIAGIAGITVEVKNAARVSLAEWLDEATIERDNANARHGVVWFKRRGYTSPGRGFVLMDGETFTNLLAEAGYR